MQYRTARSVFAPVRPIHRLQKEMAELQPFKLRRHRAHLRKHQLQFFSGRLHAARAPAFGLTHSQSMPAGAATVPFVSTAISKPRSCSASISTAIQLQQRLAARTHHKTPSSASSCSGQAAPSHPPALPPSQTSRRPRPSTSDKFRVAESADRFDARSALASRPQIASREPAEHRRASRLSALALQRIENLFDRVAHRARLPTSGG